MIVKLTRIYKRRESYHVEGLVGPSSGSMEPAGFAIAARDVEGLSRADFEALCLRNLPDCVESKRYEVAV